MLKIIRQKYTEQRENNKSEIIATITECIRTHDVARAHAFMSTISEDDLEIASRCLSLAIYSSEWEIVELLLAAGVNGGMTYKSLNCALYAACSCRQLGLVQTLLNYGAFIDYQTNRGVTSLTCAVYNRDIDMVKLLLDNGANPTVGETRTGLVHEAMMMESVPILDILLPYSNGTYFKYNVDNDEAPLDLSVPKPAAQ